MLVIRCWIMMSSAQFGRHLTQTNAVRQLLIGGQEVLL